MMESAYLTYTSRGVLKQLGNAGGADDFRAQAVLAEIINMAL